MLTIDLAQTPRGKNADPDAPDPMKQARDLAKKQEDLNEKMEPLRNDNAAKQAQHSPPGTKRAPANWPRRSSCSRRSTRVVETPRPHLRGPRPTIAFLRMASCMIARHRRR